MNYQEALDYLTSLGRFGIKLGLERTDALLQALKGPARLEDGDEFTLGSVRLTFRVLRAPDFSETA